MHTAAVLPYVPVGAEHLLFFSHTDLKCFPRGWSWTSFPQTLPRKHQKKSLPLKNKTSKNSHSTAKKTQFQMKLENFSTNSRPEFPRVLGPLPLQHRLLKAIIHTVRLFKMHSNPTSRPLTWKWVHCCPGIGVNFSRLNLCKASEKNEILHN